MSNKFLNPQHIRKTLTFEQLEKLLTRHLEKRLTAIQEKLESYLQKLSKTVANIEWCRNQNTKTLQQNIDYVKNKIHSKNEIITTPINKHTDLLEKSKSHAIIKKSPYKDKHQYKQRSQQYNYRKVKSRQYILSKPCWISKLWEYGRWWKRSPWS